MTPFIRGRIFPEVEHGGRAKRSLDVLLWMNGLSANEIRDLDEIEVLRNYLASIDPAVCTIDLHVPEPHAATAGLLARYGITVSLVPVSEPDAKVAGVFKQGAPESLNAVAATTLACNADVVVVGERQWLPYVEEFGKLGMLLADTGVLKRQAELFVRGHEVPWAFDYKCWGMAWTVFYQLVENRTFRDGVDFLYNADRKKLDAEALETARMLVHNRLPNMCFTRDRLLFYEMQQSVAKRAGWLRQDFSFEVAYHLNFYYLVIYGGFDHIAAVVNGALGLGLPEKNVGATYKGFLDALEAKAPEIHALFAEPGLVELVKVIAALRHFTAHRGSIMPAKVYEKPEVEPTNEELDADIAKSGGDIILNLLPEGEIREAQREALRLIARVKRYEQVADGLVPIEIDGKQCFIRPMNDIEWNFNKFHSFMVKVLNALLARI